MALQHEYEFDTWFEREYPERDDRQCKFRMSSVRDLMLAAYLAGTAAPVLDAVGVEKPQQGWISVDDRLPEESKDVLVLYWPYDNHVNAQLVGQAHYHDGGFYNDDGDDWHPPSHWMPLPPTPATQPAAAPAPTDAGIPISDDKLIADALEIAHDLAIEQQAEVSVRYEGYKPDKHAAAARDVATTKAALAAWQARGQQQAGVADVQPAAKQAEGAAVKSESDQIRAALKPASEQQAGVPCALARIAEQMRAGGARLPAPACKGTIESALTTGLSIGLCIVQSEIDAFYPSVPGEA